MEQKKTHLREKSAFSACLLILLPFACFGLLLLLKALYVRYIVPIMPPCWFRLLTGKLCPACGMTHSVIALTHLDLLTSAKENLLVPLGVLALLLLYAELWARFAGHKKHFLPRSRAFWYGVFAFCVLYAVLRNLIPIS